MQSLARELVLQKVKRSSCVTMMFMLSGVLLISVGLSACAVKAPESQMLKVAQMAPDSWSASKEGKAGVGRGWVNSFGDAQLTKLVSEAMHRNADMRVADQRVRQARRAAYVAGSASRPMMAAEFSKDRSKRQFFGAPFTGDQTLDGNYADIKVSWEPDLWGRVRMGQSAALSDAQSAELDAKAAKSILAAEVSKAWFALGEANEQLRLAKEVVEIRQQAVEMIADRFERNLGNDGGSASQLRLAETDLALAKANAAQRVGDVAIARGRLEILCGRYPAGKLKGARTLTKVPKAPPVGVPSSLLQRRPDIQAAERRYAAAEARVKEANRAIFPLIKLTGSGGSASEVLENLVDGKFNTWSLGAGLTQNLLTGGRVIGEKQIRDSKSLEELAKLEGVVLKAFGEVETALVLEEWLRKRSQHVEKAYKFSKAAVASANDDYLAGTGDALTLLTAQSRAVEIGSQVLVLKRARLENRVDLHLALGGAFRLEEK